MKKMVAKIGVVFVILCGSMFMFGCDQNHEETHEITVYAGDEPAKVWINSAEIAEAHKDEIDSLVAVWNEAGQIESYNVIGHDGDLIGNIPA